MKRLNNLLIVAGTGRNSGKTSLACNIIQKFSGIEPVGLKISPHFHKPSEGLVLLHDSDNYNIYRETSREGRKDSSKMLLSGASDAFYIQVYDKHVGDAFSWLMNNLDLKAPIVCESPALRQYIVPGVFLIADSDRIIKKKELGEIYKRADKIIQLGSNTEDLILDYRDGKWVM